jgi:hypothetical protein
MSQIPRLASGALVASLALPLSIFAQAPAPAELREADLRAHIGYLASEELEGRESGEEGGRLAEIYVEAHFRRLGLEPLPGQTAMRLPFKAGARTCNNVVAVLPGRDPALRGKYLAIGGHLDHAGIGGPGAMGFPGEIHNGADDNASGTAGMMELAEWYAAHPPRHSVIFMGFSAEERGLLGSQHLVDEKVVPVADIVAMVNLDMIGRSNGYCFIAGLGTAVEFRGILNPIFDRVKDVRLELSDLGEAPSDNTSFYHGGIPAIFFFTHVHDDYHMPTDDADKIDYAGEVRVLQMAREAVDAIDAAPKLTFQKSDGMGMPADFNERMGQHYSMISKRSALRGKLGVVADEAVGGLAVTSISAASAAEAVGLVAGDLIKQVNGRDVRSLADLRRAMGGAMRGDTVTLLVQRGAESLNLTATLK